MKTIVTDCNKIGECGLSLKISYYTVLTLHSFFLLYNFTGGRFVLTILATAARNFFLH